MALLHTLDHKNVQGVRVGIRHPGGGYGLITSCIIYHLGDTVIDTGPANQWKYVKQYLESKSVRQALITHYHEDHSGNAGNFHQCFGCTVMSHPSAHHRLSDGIVMNWMRRLMFGKNTQVESVPVPDVVETSTNRLQAFNLQGHTPDSMCFLDTENGQLYSGDLYVASRIAYMQHEEDISEYINSLNAALALDFQELCCAHQGIIPDGKQALSRKLDFIENMVGEVKHLHDKGLNERAITRKLLGKEDMRTYLSGGMTSKRSVIRACLRHLDH